MAAVAWPRGRRTAISRSSFVPQNGRRRGRHIGHSRDPLIMNHIQDEYLAT